MDTRSKRTSGDAVITIVSGLPRSGTSMLMRMLEAGGMTTLVDAHRKADSDNPNGYYEFELVKNIAEDASWLENATGQVVKMVYRLLYDLPPEYCYRVCFLERDIKEVLASQNKMLERNGLESHCNDSDMAALFKQELSSFWNWVETKDYISTERISHHELLTNTNSEILKIKNFLSIDLDTNAMLKVVDPSLYRNKFQ